MTTKIQRGWLLLGALLIAGYAVTMVLAGSLTAGLFDALGFGPSAGAVPDGPPRDHVLFVHAVLGAVLVGWMITIAGIAAGPLRTDEAWARPVLLASIGAWFVLDTGASLAFGSWPHALFNLVFLAVLGPPLLRGRRARSG